MTLPTEQEKQSGKHVVKTCTKLAEVRTETEEDERERERGKKWGENGNFFCAVFEFLTDTGFDITNFLCNNLDVTSSSVNSVDAIDTISSSSSVDVVDTSFVSYSSASSFCRATPYD